MNIRIFTGNKTPASDFICPITFNCNFYHNFRGHDFSYKDYQLPYLKHAHVIGWNSPILVKGNDYFQGYDFEFAQNSNRGTITLGLPFDSKKELIKWKLKYLE